MGYRDPRQTGPHQAKESDHKLGQLQTFASDSGRARSSQEGQGRCPREEETHKDPEASAQPFRGDKPTCPHIPRNHLRRVFFPEEAAHFRRKDLLSVTQTQQQSLDFGIG